MQINSNLNYQYLSAYKNNTPAVNKNATQPNFGLRNPQAAMERAINLKALYAKQGLNYLLPNQAYSTARIEKMVKSVDSNIVKAFKENNISSGFILNEINKILPQKDKNSIIPADMSKLPEFLRKYLKKDEAYIKTVMENCGGLKTQHKGITYIFVPFGNIKNAENKESAILKMREILAHELTHALNSKYQNFRTATQYHRNNLDDKYNSFFFNKFEMNGIYKLIPKVKKAPAELTKEGLFKYLNINTEKDLFEKFEQIFNNIVNSDFKTEKSTYNTKQFFEFCKAKARDEKLAYKTRSILRETCNDPKTPTNKEYNSMLYAEAEKFFAKKAKEAQKAFEKS